MTNFQRVFRNCFLLILLTLCAGATWAAGKPVPAPEQIAKRLQSVGTLIEKSSAAAQIEKSGTTEAKAQREAARSLHGQAEQEFKTGDYAASARFLDMAAQAMFAAVRASAPEQITADKKRRDFDNRRESIAALTDAMGRVSAEKGMAAPLAKVQSMTAEAQRLAAAGDMDRGRAMLDEAYVTAKTAIKGMRGGDTLVRSLQFASKEQEFEYEVARNRSYEELIPTAIATMKPGPDQRRTVEAKLDEGRSKRAEALQLAKKRDYESAVAQLQQASAVLQAALESLGLSPTALAG